MTDSDNGNEGNPLDAFLEETHSELDQLRAELKEIGLLVEQSEGEVDKLAQRNASITAHLHQIQSHFDTVPREDIRSAYEAAQDAQQRLFTMRGQLEKLQSDQIHMTRLSDYMARTLELLEGRPTLTPAEGEAAPAAARGIGDLIQAQEDERRKISRQIHDGPAQSLSNFILQTEIALRLFDNDQERARDELSNLKAAATASFANVRDFIFDLRPMMLDDLGLVPTVRRYAEAFKDKTGMDLNLVVTGTERRLAPSIEVLIFRAIQDLLANVREHAQATQVKIMIDIADKQVRATLEDNGKGFAPEILENEQHEDGGLNRIKQQVAQFGGTFDIDSSPGQGTRVMMSVPTRE
ncbi:MAG: histidine kinase [Anaerolineales bacterium]|jgi:two-component system sensor histidine kinase DegS